MVIKDVNSTSIKSVAYDADERKMWLRFKSDALYEYNGVEPQVVKDMLKAESKGHFFHENIKNKYDYLKVEE